MRITITYLEKGTLTKQDQTEEIPPESAGKERKHGETDWKEHSLRGTLEGRRIHGGTLWKTELMFSKFGLN